MPSSSQSVDVVRFIDERRLSRFQLFVIALCFVILTVDAYDVVAIGYAVPSIIGEWHVTKAQLGIAMSAGVMGMTVGALTTGPLSDWSSPKRVMFAMLVVSSLGSMLTAYADNVTLLTVLRFVTGVGIGAVMPIASTIAHEYAPSRRGPLVVNIVNCGAMLGASSCGVIAAILIPSYGWSILFVIGGVVPLALAIVCLIAMPEPIRFMAVRDWPRSHIARILRHIDPQESFEGASFHVAGEADQPRLGLSVILSHGLRLSTLLLWTAYFFGAFVFYLLNSWMPLLLRDTGANASQASWITSLFSLGGAAGALLLGWLMGRFEKNSVVAASVALGAAALWILGQNNGNLPILTGCAFLVGACLSGATVSMAALAASSYPSSGRTTGISCMNGVGRIGGMLGPLMGALMFKHGLAVSTMFALLAIPALIQSVSLLFKRSAKTRFSSLEYPGKAV
jgi:AAHS family 4-hydroxybenzoate transporter-like MFS transporter